MTLCIYLLGFDEAIRKHEHEFQVQSDSLNNDVLAFQLKVSEFFISIIAR